MWHNQRRGVSVPDPLVHIIHSECSIFLSIQSTRFEDRIALTSSAFQPSEWCEAYRQAVALLGDRLVNSTWGLVSHILQIIEANGSLTMNASAAVVSWYRNFMLDIQYIENRRRELQTLDLGRCADEEVIDIGAFYIELIEGSFFTGQLDTAAGLLDELLASLRQGAARVLTAEVEDCLADVRRLLVASFHDADSFAHWRSDANEQIYAAKRILGEAVSTETAQERVADSLRALCLNILLVASGDARLVYDRCLQSELPFVEYLTAICAVIHPYAFLGQLRDALSMSLGDWTFDGNAAWIIHFLRALFAAHNLEDVVNALQTLADGAKQHFPWSPETMYAPGSEVEEEYRDIGDLTPPLNGDNPSAKRFGLACLAAHVADICAPAITAPSTTISLTFTRNNLVADYIHLFGEHPRTWKIAATYAAYSPFMNPKELYQLTTYAAELAAYDNAAYQSLNEFLRLRWDAGSAHQMTLRRLLRDRLEEHPTLQQWIDILDYERRQAVMDCHRFIISTRFNHGDVASAVWLAVETNVTKPVQFVLRSALRSAGALEDTAIYQVGEAVHHSFIALDTCSTVDLVQSLYTCAALFAYRQALAAVHVATSQKGGPSPAVETLVQTQVRCVDRIEQALSRIDACDFAFHPDVIFTLVEHGLDLVMAVRGMLQRHGSASCEHLGSSVLPLLARAFSLASIQGSRRTLPCEMVKRANAIREKMCRTLEGNTD